MTDRAEAIQAVAVLNDDLRSGMYWFIRNAGRPVTREEVAERVGISRNLAAFHLDKLVEAGLLNARYGSVDGTPRIGRSPKIYETSHFDLQISIPQRRHEVLAEILSSAVLTQQDGETAREAATRIANTRGRDAGTAERESLSANRRLGPERAMTLMHRLLADQGYEPYRAGTNRMRLRNCPFHPLAADEPEFVCGLNHALLNGMLTGLDTDAVEACLAPQAGECCVEVRSTRSGG